MNRYLIAKNSLNNLHITSETWSDVKEYIDEFKYVIKQREIKRIPFSHSSPQASLRHIVTDYLKSFAIKNKLTHCTLHLATYILDVFMDNHSITNERLYLVANVCLLLAGKFEENNQTIPYIKDLNISFEHLYTRADYKASEIVILRFFNWFINFPTAAHYVHYFIQFSVNKDDLEKKEDNWRTVIIEMNVIIEKYLDKVIDDVHYMQLFKPSVLAAAIISLGREQLNMQKWTSELRDLTNYTLFELTPAIKALTQKLPLYCTKCVKRDQNNNK